MKRSPKVSAPFSPAARRRRCARDAKRPAAETSRDTLEALLENDTKKALYVFDDINYASGARAAALAQARAVSGVAEVWLYSAEPCRDAALRQEFRLLEIPDGGGLRLLSRPTRQVLRDGDVSLAGKLLRLAYAVLAHIGLESVLPKALLRRNMAAAFETFDTIFVVSEASKMREFVSRCRHPGKIQWIHTDYAAWRELNEWTRAVTKNDAALYRRFDAIVCLNRTLREKFLAVYPQFADQDARRAEPGVPRRDTRARQSAAHGAGGRAGLQSHHHRGGSSAKSAMTGCSISPRS